MPAIHCVLVVIVLAVAKCQAQTYPFMNTSLSFEERVKVSMMYSIIILCVTHFEILAIAYSDWFD